MTYLGLRLFNSFAAARQRSRDLRGPVLCYITDRDGIPRLHGCGPRKCVDLTVYAKPIGPFLMETSDD